MLFRYGLPQGWPCGRSGKPLRFLVDSVAIRSIGYVAAAALLEIEVRGRYFRRLTWYHEVPPEKFTSLASAPNSVLFLRTELEGRYRTSYADVAQGYYENPPLAEWEQHSMADAWGYR